MKAVIAAGVIVLALGAQGCDARTPPNERPTKAYTCQWRLTGTGGPLVITNVVFEISNRSDVTRDRIVNVPHTSPKHRCDNRARVTLSVTTSSRIITPKKLECRLTATDPGTGEIVRRGYDLDVQPTKRKLEVRCRLDLAKIR
jgi:hypothetical protein